ncbi:MAG: thiol peroxidase [Myxococcales bacterium]|nr:thiol peroxidase [Myxococcales bacterium]
MRKAVTKWGGNDTDLAGPEIKVGQQAPEFTVTGNDGKPVTLKDTSGKVRIFASMPSLDTPVCDIETKRFNTEAATIPGVEIWTISMDLPMAQKRWCGAAGVDKVRTVSDHKAGSFGEAFGVLEPNRRLLARAVFVVDKGDVVRHVEYVASVGDQPNYGAALEIARSL